MPPGMHPPSLPTLDELVRGFHSAASQASALLQQQSALLLKEYFSVASDGRTLVAKVVKIALDQHHYTLVPLVSLVSPSAFSLETMKVKLAVRFDQVETRMQDGMVDESGKGANFRVSVSPINNAPEGSSSGPRYVELEFIFKQHDPPEGIQRILEQFTNAIVPKAETEGALYDANPVLEFPSAMPPPSDADLQD
ncbi:conserved hypothetical protein [Burkholderiales bacterium 8X]|nr:conserved hypothetical protein [Burkholderiales bacterium 8X]